MDAATREQQLQEAITMRQQPLNELQQLMQMQSYSNPQFGNFASATGAKGTDYTGAAKDMYGAQVGATNAANAGKAGVTSGIVGLAGAAAVAF
jgi:DNA-directed RNA polymerase specialized sigma54-like protein